MEKIFEDMENMELPEDVQSEIILLYNLGVGIDDLRYFLELRMNRII